MKNFLICVFFALGSLTSWGEEIIYGMDERKDYYEVTNFFHRKLADASAAMIHKGHFVRTSHPDFFSLYQLPTLQESDGVCSTEKFSQQKVAASCSGFLVAPDILVTAGHCLTTSTSIERACKDFAWVFDYHLKNQFHDPSKNISRENVYQCSRVIDFQRIGPLSPLLKLPQDVNIDYAIIKLDRRVTKRTPLRFRTTGKVSSQADLLVIGNPSSLPQKIALHGTVTNNDELTHFQTTLDTFHGNSGSPVIDARTGLVEGILIAGKTDYVNSVKGDPYSCMVVNRCNDYSMGCSDGYFYSPPYWGEIVMRITQIAERLDYAIRYSN